jgi:hypothetical protein
MSASRLGGTPNIRRYSRLKAEAYDWGADEVASSRT